MGREKAALLVNGEPLWQRQLAALRATEPAEIFISGKSDGPYAGCGVEILTDEIPDCGPLGGIATALRRCTSERLLVLAVDMPAMTAGFLRTLLDESSRTGKGVVPAVAADGTRRANLEPLAAVYPRAAISMADDCLCCGEWKLETFIRRLESDGLIVVLSVASDVVGLFENWNAPEDLPRKG